MKRRHFFKTTLALGVAGLSPAARGQWLPAAQQQSGDDGAEANAPADLSFGVIADPQYADQPPRGTRFYRNSLPKLKSAIQQLNQHKLDFVITLGDLIDRDLRSFSDILPLYRKLAVPHRMVLGNHDFDVADGDKNRVQSALKLSRCYGSETRGRWRLIYLDGTEVATYRYPKQDPRTAAAAKQLQIYKADKRVNAHAWNSAISTDQLDWLHGELQTSRRKQQQVIIFCHFPVLPANEPHNLWNAREVVELIQRFDHVAAYMNGHNHGGNYDRQGSCHFVNFKGMVETESRTAYAVVSCFADRLEIDGYGSEPDQELN